MEGGLAGPFTAAWSARISQMFSQQTGNVNETVFDNLGLILVTHQVNIRVIASIDGG